MAPCDAGEVAVVRVVAAPDNGGVGCGRRTCFGTECRARGRRNALVVTVPAPPLPPEVVFMPALFAGPVGRYGCVTGTGELNLWRLYADDHGEV